MTAASSRALSARLQSAVSRFQSWSRASARPSSQLQRPAVVDGVLPFPRRRSGRLARRRLEPQIERVERAGRVRGPDQTAGAFRSSGARSEDGQREQRVRQHRADATRAIALETIEQVPPRHQVVAALQRDEPAKDERRRALRRFIELVPQRPGTLQQLIRLREVPVGQLQKAELLPQPPQRAQVAGPLRDVAPPASRSAGAPRGRGCSWREPRTPRPAPARRRRGRAPRPPWPPRAPPRRRHSSLCASERRIMSPRHRHDCRPPRSRAPTHGRRRRAPARSSFSGHSRYPSTLPRRAPGAPARPARRRARAPTRATRGPRSTAHGSNHHSSIVTITRSTSSASPASRARSSARLRFAPSASIRRVLGDLVAAHQAAGAPPRLARGSAGHGALPPRPRPDVRRVARPRTREPARASPDASLRRRRRGASACS